MSWLCEEIDERVGAFLERPREGARPYLWIDATYVKVRKAGRIVSVATIVAVGVNGEGRREVLGMASGPSETDPFRTALLLSVTRQGLRGVKLVISDAHEGLTFMDLPKEDRARIHSTNVLERLNGEI